MAVEPKFNREVRLRVPPSGLPTRDHLRMVAVRIPAPATGQVLVRNLYFVVSASLRQMISEGASEVAGVPFPALTRGDCLFAETVGEVIKAPPGSGLSPGDKVLHFLGWRDYAVVAVEQCYRLDRPLPAPIGYLGYLGHGWTAFAALTRGVSIRPGDTVFVSSAAGAIGSMAGQVARLLGAGRVIGSTSSQAKADRLVSELGYDAALVRSDSTSLAEQLQQAAPAGIDVYFDTVGGDHLQAALAAARVGARMVIVGTLSGQLASTGTGRTAPVQLDSTQILVKRITIRGYSADDHPEAREEWMARLHDGLRHGGICLPHVVIEGLEQAAVALQDTVRGRYFGMVVVRV